MAELVCETVCLRVQRETTMFLSRLGNSLPFSRVLRQLEREMETVVGVLQPGPLGIIEHKFSANEMQEADATVKKAVESWRRNADLEKRSQFMKDFID